jgi:mono/diheme cytochrome c family protein
MFRLTHCISLLALLAALGSGLLGCNQGQTQQAAAPAEPPPLSGPASYAKNCQMCHGPKGAGVKNLGVPLLKLSDRIPDENIRHFIRNGRGKMPGFKQMSDTELGALIAHIKTF